MMAKNLAEAVLLQSIEDLWDKKESKKCFSFFKGNGFHLCSDIAGISPVDRRKLLSLIVRSIKQRQKPVEAAYI
jgi:hypothetical protein